MKDPKNSSSSTRFAHLITLVSIISIVFGPSACSKGKIIEYPGSFVSHGKIYLKYITPNGIYPQNVSLAVFRAQDGKLLWQDSSAPLAMEDATTVYIETPTTLSARDPESGKERWHTPVELLPIAQQNGIVYAHDIAPGGPTDVGQFLFAFEESTGKQLWMVKLPSQIADMQFLVDQEHIAVQSRGIVSSALAPMHEMVSVFRTQDGKFLWSSSRTSPSTWLGGNTLLSANGVLYATEKGSSEIHAFRESDGKLLWSFKQAPALFSFQAITDGILVLENYQRILGLRATTGKPLWSQSVEGVGDVLADKGIIYVSSYSGPKRLLFALRAQDGRERWRFSIDSYATIHIHLDTARGIISISDGFAAAVQANGTLLWKIRSSNDEDNHISDGIVYRLIPEGLVDDRFFTQMHLIAIRGNDGKSLWDTRFQL